MRKLLLLLLLLAALAALAPAQEPTPLQPSDTNNLPVSPAPAPVVPGSSNSSDSKSPSPASPPPPSPPPPPPAPPTPPPFPFPFPPTSSPPAVVASSTSPAPNTSPGTPAPSDSAAARAPSAPPPAAAGAPSSPTLSTSSRADPGGMSAGAIIGIILAVLAVAAIGGFFLYRHLRGGAGGHAHAKDFAGSPQEVTIMGSHQTDYALAKMERQSSQDMPIMAAAGSSAALGSLNTSSYASSSANLYPNANKANVTLYGGSERPSSPAASPPAAAAAAALSKSTARFLNGPDQESPPFKKTDVQLSRPSTSNLEEPTEFGHSFTHSFAESYAESYSESYSDRGYMSSFVQGMPGSDGLSVGASSAMGDALDRQTATHAENAHWLDAMDEMRDTGDSYAMLEAYGSERGSAISRFSTDSEFDSGTSRQL